MSGIATVGHNDRLHAKRETMWYRYRAHDPSPVGDFIAFFLILGWEGPLAFWSAWHDRDGWGMVIGAFFTAIFWVPYFCCVIVSREEKQIPERKEPT